MSMTRSLLDLLRDGVESYHPYLQPDGELHDPVFGEPTQYGTAYHAFANAVLAHVAADGRAEQLDRAVRGLDAALRHTGDPTRPASASGFSRATGAVRRSNHRDFTWPPILKTYRLLAAAGVDRADEFAERIAAVDIMRSFSSRPPSNWSAVWLSGEWIRIRAGLSPFTVADVDRWLAVFFADRLRPDDGFYEEPGKPNSYDLFTRYHLADLLVEGYDGAWRAALERLMVTGLARSLGVQLSDGSLASAHRSAGQTWTLGAQVAYFTHAATYFAGRADDDLAAQARAAAWRAFTSMRRWQRPGATFSPVENLLPAGYRIGYERYTADAHYGNLALAFLAVAVLSGCTAADGSTRPAPTPPAVDAAPAVTAPRPAEVPTSDGRTWVERAPLFRAVVHAGRYSVAVNGDPAPAYDAFGITDLTVGEGRFLQFASSVKHTESGAFLNLGTARRPGPGRTELDILAQHRPVVVTLEDDASLVPPDERGAGLRLEGVEPAPEASDERPATAGERPGGLPYALRLAVTTTGVTVEEATPGVVDHRTLLVPYLRDPGTGQCTVVDELDDGVVLTLGSERVAVTTTARVEALVHLPYGFENRRGLCGLVRLDLAEPTDRVTYRVTVLA